MTVKHGTGEYGLFGPRRDGVKKGVAEISAEKFVGIQRVIVGIQRVKIHDEVGSKNTPQRKCKIFPSENVKGKIDLIKTRVEWK